MEFCKGPCGRRIFQVDLETTSKCSVSTKEVWTQKHCDWESERAGGPWQGPQRKGEFWWLQNRAVAEEGRMAQFDVQAWGPEFGSAYNPSWELEVERVTLGAGCFPQSFYMLFWGRVSSWTWSCVWGSQASQLALGTLYLCLLHTGITYRHSMPTQIFLCGFWGFRLLDSSIQVGVLPSEPSPQFPNNWLCMEFQD